MILNEAPAAKAVKNDSADGHYYACNGGIWSPLHGTDKKYGMRGARKDHAEGKSVVPSVTGYLGEVKKRQVDDWAQKQVAKAAYNLSQVSRLSEEDFIDSAIDLASRASHPARDLGSRIHAAIELAVAGGDYDAALDVYVQPVMAERAKWGLESIAQEKCVGNLVHGYAGRVDDICTNRIIVDYKTRGEAKDYPTDWCQIASYGYAEFGDDFFKTGAGLVFPISTKVPGEVKPVMKLGHELVRYFEGFIGLTAIWRVTHNFDPRAAAVSNQS